jgi:ribosomal protein L37AE/L43A
VSVEELEVDELLRFDPEPCPSCDRGIRWTKGHDGQWRCRNCVMALASEKGWDELPASVTKIETARSAAPSAETTDPTLPFS